MLLQRLATLRCVGASTSHTAAWLRLVRPQTAAIVAAAGPRAALVHGSAMPLRYIMTSAAAKSKLPVATLTRRTGTRYATSSSTPASNAGKPQADTAAAEAAVVAHGSSLARLKDLWNKYGIVAIGTYFTMYGAVLGSIYVAIDQGWLSTAKPSKSDPENPENADFNVVTATNKFVTYLEDLGIAKYFDVQRVNSKTGTFLLAWVATKFTEPLRLAVTLAITPRIARFVGRAPQLAIKNVATRAASSVKSEKPAAH